MKRLLIRALPNSLLLALAATVPFASLAVPSVNPGQTYQFVHPDSGGTECRLGTGHLPDTRSCDPGTRFDTAGNFVKALFDVSLPAGGLGEANYSTAWIYNDFSIPGDSTNLVDAQISVTFDYFGVLVAAGAFKTSGTLTLQIEDRTGGSLVTASTIFQQERSGDQGLSDIATGQELQYPRGEVASVQVKLKRGRTYRITFKLEVLAEEFAVGRVVASTDASWQKLSVSVAGDQVEQLSLHDSDIKAALVAHDAAIKLALATHDADIKRKLDQLDGKLTDITNRLDEIKELLITPQGRRPGFPKK